MVTTWGLGFRVEGFDYENRGTLIPTSIRFPYNKEHKKVGTPNFGNAHVGSSHGMNWTTTPTTACFVLSPMCSTFELCLFGDCLYYGYEHYYYCDYKYLSYYDSPTACLRIGLVLHGSCSSNVM